MNTDFLIYALSSAMNLPTFSSPSSVPSNLPASFGVFVGVSRSKAFQLKEWPHDVHGSNGYWDVNYNELSNVELWKHILSVSKTAVNEGGYDRASKFLDLSWDGDAEFSIKFMLKHKHSPTLISSDGQYTNRYNNKVNFNNKDVGIIVHTESGRRATYLSGVYNNMEFKDITQKLLEKAESQYSTHNTYYALMMVFVTYQLLNPFYSRLILVINH